MNIVAASMATVIGHGKNCQGASSWRLTAREGLAGSSGRKEMKCGSRFAVHRPLEG